MTRRVRYRIARCECSCDRWGIWSTDHPLRVIGATTAGTPILTVPLRWFYTWREAINALNEPV